MVDQPQTFRHHLRVSKILFNQKTNTVD